MHCFAPGDIFACYGTDAASLLIRGATASFRAPAGLRLGPSHVAICAHDHRGALAWWESTTLAERPCQIQGRRVRGVQCHAIFDRLDDYVRAGGRVEIYRLVQIDQLGTAEEIRLDRILRSWIRRNTSYDMVGAAISGLRTPWLKRLLLRSLPDAGRESLFCSELIAACLMRLSRINRENPNAFSPAKLLRRLIFEGTYTHETTFDALDAIARVAMRESVVRGPWSVGREAA